MIVTINSFDKHIKFLPCSSFVTAPSDADSSFAITSVFAHRVKPLLVTLIELQGGLRTNLQLPRIKLAANKIVQTANE